MSQSKISSTPKPSQEIWRQADDWAEVDEKEERKKRQNRLNQRAFRKRNAEKEGGSKMGKRRPFRVERFRVMEVGPMTKGEETKPPFQPSLEKASVEQPSPSSELVVNYPAAPAYDFNPANVLPSTALQYTATLPPTGTITTTFAFSPEDLLAANLEDSTSYNKARCITRLSHLATHALPQPNPLSSDHLIHLIHYNVYRALIINKILVKNSTTQIKLSSEVLIPSTNDLCDGLSFCKINSIDAPLPKALAPTVKQEVVAHAAWVNMFPYPRVRDNLIKHQLDFSHIDLCNDLWGEFFFCNTGELFGPTTSKPNSPSDPNDEDEDDDITSQRRGFIVWGDSWDFNGWEVTRGFLEKWSWILEGCEELIVSTNYWRAKRDLKPLTFPLGGKSPTLVPNTWRNPGLACFEADAH